MAWYDLANEVTTPPPVRGKRVKVSVRTSRSKNNTDKSKTEKSKEKSETATNSNISADSKSFLDLYNETLNKRGSIKNFSDEELELMCGLNVKESDEIQKIKKALTKEKVLRVQRITNLQKEQETQQRKREEAAQEAAQNAAQEEKNKLISQIRDNRQKRYNELQDIYGEDLEDLEYLTTRDLISYDSKLKELNTEIREELERNNLSSSDLPPLQDIEDLLIHRAEEYLNKGSDYGEGLKEVQPYLKDLYLIKSYLQDLDLNLKIEGKFTQMLDSAYSSILSTKSYKERQSKLKRFKQYIDNSPLLQDLASQLRYPKDVHDPDTQYPSLLDKITRSLITPSTIQEAFDDARAALVNTLRSLRLPRIKPRLSKKQQKVVDKKAATSAEEKAATSAEEKAATSAEEKVPTSETPAPESTNTKHWWDHRYVPLVNRNWWDVRHPEYWAWNSIPWALRSMNAGVYNLNLPDDKTPWTVGDFVGVKKGVPFQVFAPTWWIGEGAYGLSSLDWKNIATTDVDLTKIGAKKEADLIEVIRVPNTLNPEFYHFITREGTRIEEKDFDPKRYKEVDAFSNNK